MFKFCDFFVIVCNFSYFSHAEKHVNWNFLEVVIYNLLYDEWLFVIFIMVKMNSINMVTYQ